MKFPSEIVYVTNARLPTEKAHGLATVKLASAFAAAGIPTTVVVPWRWNPIKDDPYAFYGVPKNFRIVRVPSFDLLWLGFGQRIWFPVQLFSFSLVAAVWLALRVHRLRDAVVFSHDHIPLFFASFVAPYIAYDIHSYPVKSFWYARVLRRARCIVTQTRAKVAMLQRDFSISAERIVSWPNGTDVGQFQSTLAADEARAELGLPQDKKIVCYTGQLFRWKGVETLLRASRLLPADYLICIVGGDEAAIGAVRQWAGGDPFDRVRFFGQRPWSEMPIWLRAADVLVLPNTAKDEESRLHTSPMKLFEYMASGRPIVASDLPSIREIVDKTTVALAEPDNAAALADAIRAGIEHPQEAAHRAARAQQAVQRYTWAARAERILGGLARV
ncbi:glycosyltransferase [Candidatus Parcubacteria bacterium]|nr:MAG: glycosyltransferase [Candidatus Parcubacteria bacterium]